VSTRVVLVERTLETPTVAIVTASIQAIERGQGGAKERDGAHHHAQRPTPAEERRSQANGRVELFGHCKHDDGLVEGFGSLAQKTVALANLSAG
jgi:hypothetical protein